MEIAGDLKNSGPGVSSSDIVRETAVGILAQGWGGTAFFPLLYCFKWLSCFNCNFSQEMRMRHTLRRENFSQNDFSLAKLEAIKKLPNEAMPNEAHQTS